MTPAQHADEARGRTARAWSLLAPSRVAVYRSAGERLVFLLAGRRTRELDSVATAFASPFFSMSVALAQRVGDESYAINPGADRPLRLQETCPLGCAAVGSATPRGVLREWAAAVVARTPHQAPAVRLVVLAPDAIERAIVRAWREARPSDPPVLDVFRGLTFGDRLAVLARLHAAYRMQ